MKRLLLTIFAFSLFQLHSNDLPFNGNGYGIDQTRNGYLEYYIFDEAGNKIQLFDSGGYVNNRIFIKDSDKRFYLRNRSKYVIKRTDETLTIKWRVDSYNITEKFNLITNGFNYSIEIENRTDRPRTAGVYIMYDTILGEESRQHFIENEFNIIKNEKLYSGRSIPESLKSVNEAGQGIEFRVMDTKNNKPGYLILGNWDRLANSKKWPYKPLDGGFFSYGYYSINDSGVGIVYPEVKLPVNSKVIYSYDLIFITDTSQTEISDKVIEEDEGDKWNQSETTESDDLDNTVDKPDKDIPIESLTFESSDDEETKADEPVIIDDDEFGDLFESETFEKTDNNDTEEEIDTTDSLEEPETLENLIENSDELENSELQRMLEYVQKKKRGEDVSEYNFTEEEILNKLQKR